MEEQLRDLQEQVKPKRLWDTLAAFIKKDRPTLILYAVMVYVAKDRPEITALVDLVQGTP